MPIPIFPAKVNKTSQYSSEALFIFLVSGKGKKEDIYVAGKFYPAEVLVQEKPSKLKTKYTWQEVAATKSIRMDGRIKSGEV